MRKAYIGALIFIAYSFWIHISFSGLDYQRKLVPVFSIVMIWYFLRDLPRNEIVRIALIAVYARAIYTLGFIFDLYLPYDDDLGFFVPLAIMFGREIYKYGYDYSRKIAKLANWITDWHLRNFRRNTRNRP